MNGSFELVRAIRGPILLIVIGSLFALDQMKDIGFSRTWPVLIIAIGVLKLLERAAWRQPALPANPYPPAPAAGWQQPPVQGVQQPNASNPWQGGNPQ